MNKEERLISLCQEAVRIPSMSGQEKQAAELVRHTVISYGFDEVNIDRYGSVLGVIHSSRPGKTILMGGHIGTVGVIDHDQWTHDLFVAEIEGGKIYGHGTSGIEGSICAMITVAAQYAEDTGKDFAGTICVSYTVHEECFERASPCETSRNAKPNFVIIGEATTTTVKIGQRGCAEVVVETEGKSCHSPNPEKGVNVMYHMMVVIEAIRYIQMNEHPILGKGILKLTDIISSPYPGASVVPFVCRATFDRRILVGEDKALILDQIEETIEKAKKKVPDLRTRIFLAEGREQCWTGETVEVRRYFPAWLIDEKDELVQKTLAGLKGAGVDALISHFSFCTNGSHLCGEAGIPCIGFGPSLESLAYVRDEYIEVEQLKKACRGFYSILSQLTK